MKLKFKKQEYQNKAVEAVLGCFKGQTNQERSKYTIDPGTIGDEISYLEDSGFRNAEILDEVKNNLLVNIQEIQRAQNIPVSEKLVKTNVSDLNLDIEMETGTGKTYCYIKTAFELNQRFGWSKFIIVVPSIAIREGVYKSLQITADHFQATYHKKAKCFIYNSKSLHELESFSSDAGINIMVINVQAFNARGKDNRRIYEELDDFQSRRPIDVIKANRPILILDEPQKMEGKKTLDSLKEFDPLFILRYSATHKTQHNKIHRLDALDAYNQKLVKKISVRGISVKGLAGTNAYLYLESIEISKKSPVALIEFELKQKNGIKRVTRKLKQGDKLFVHSGELEQYKGFTISEINAVTNTVEFTNGHILQAGEATGDVNELALRRIQIRETIKAHFEKERELFKQGIKVLSLFFIDEVKKYRDYDQEDQKGEYARIFEEEYEKYLAQQELPIEEYQKYLTGFSVAETHNGYFSIDKKGKLIDSKETGRGADKQCNDVDAYDLILKDKERLLSFDEPTRFIFSHSALREGWDNPNVFTICTLKHSDNTISRRQEVGRGLRISVNQEGERQDNPATVHNTNVLTVVASESYKDFVTALQKDISDSLSVRPKIADQNYFEGKVFISQNEKVEVTSKMAKQIYKYLVKNDYVDDDDQISDEYHEAVKNEELEPLPDELKPYQEQIFQLISSLYSEANSPQFEDGRKTKDNLLNDNFHKQEFKELWNRINKKAVYSVQFDSEELIKKCVETLNSELKVQALEYTIQRGDQREEASYDQIKSGDAFKVYETGREKEDYSSNSSVKYDLIGKIAESVQLTRKTVVQILIRIEKATFDQFKINPEHFISETIRLITEQKATTVIERLSYDQIKEEYEESEIFTQNQVIPDFGKAVKYEKHIYDYVVTDSKIERKFADELDSSSDVVVYAKLPSGFSIPTPVGNYNPDWAVSFKEGFVKHIYFIAETKGSISSMELREVEKTKIDCAKRFFEKINETVSKDKIKYDVVHDYEKLMRLVN